MERRKLVGIVCIGVALLLLLTIPALALTPLGAGVFVHPPTPTAIPPTPTPRPTPQPVLTVRGTPPALSASEFYLIDMQTEHVLASQNDVKPVPMASTTKIMTALIAIESGDLNQPIVIQQDALERIAEGGSSAGLRVGDSLTLHDMLYALMLPSGDDAAVAIADALAGSSQAFVQRMNLFAYRLHLFQTHYANPDGLSLTPEEDLQHYTTANDLTRLAEYALRIPLFAQIVHTAQYDLPASAIHARYTWKNTNTLLSSYTGMLGIKTGFTYAAGYCLVFAAERNGHTLVGVVLHSGNEELRVQDVIALLNWGFALPLLPPS